MKYILTVLLTLLLTACDRATPAAADPSKPITVVATTGMIADTARAIAGNHVTVTALMGPGVDPHLYKASTGDVRALTDASLILYNGLHLEGRMADLLVKLAATKTVVQVTDTIDESRLREPPEFEGHPDPHVWFDVSLWTVVAQRIADALANADPANASDYQSSAAAYIAELNTLHAWCKSELARIPKEQRILITAHDAFGYLGDAYGVEVLAIQGISTDSEASLKSVNALVDTIVERKVAAVFVESSVPHKTIESLIEGCKARGHNVTIGGELFSDALGPADSPAATYIGMVKHNVTTITTALLGKSAN